MHYTSKYGRIRYLRRQCTPVCRPHGEPVRLLIFRLVTIRTITCSSQSFRWLGTHASASRASCACSLTGRVDWDSLLPTSPRFVPVKSVPRETLYVLLEPVSRIRDIFGAWSTTTTGTRRYCTWEGHDWHYFARYLFCFSSTRWQTRLLE